MQGTVVEDDGTSRRPQDDVRDRLVGPRDRPLGDSRDRPRGPREPASSWPRRVAIAAGLVALGTIGVFVWLELQPLELVADRTARDASTAAPLKPNLNDSSVAATPALPLEAQSRPEPAAPLPALEKSDEVLQNLLAYLVGPGRFGALFNPTDLVHHFVATVDNLPRAQLPRRLVPMKSAAGQFTVGTGATGTAIVPANYERYRPYVAAAESIDTKQLVAGYVRFYPWFRDDYRALGYPSGAFHERLLAAIDDLLAAPDLEEPPALKQPKVLYQFADPDLEALSAGQKIMLRIGPQHSARLKTKLREIRHALEQVSVDGR